MVATRITKLVGIRYPIIQAGMGSEAGAELAGAVCNAGGLGLVGTGARPASWVREQVRRVRELTANPFGVNLLLPLTQDGTLEAVLDEEVPFISTSWGDPLHVVAAAHASGALVMHTVHTVDQAIDAANAGVDIVMAQGTDGGGHVHRAGLGTLSLVPQVRAAIGDRPLAAAGGVVDGRTAAACLALGADAVVCGTLFLMTPESTVSDSYRLALIGARSADAVLSDIPDIAEGHDWPGSTVRLIANDLIRRWTGHEDELRLKRPDVMNQMTEAVKVGDTTHLVLCSGQGIGSISSVRPASEVVARLAASMDGELIRLSAFVGG